MLLASREALRWMKTLTQASLLLLFPAPLPLRRPFPTPSTLAAAEGKGGGIDSCPVHPVWSRVVFHLLSLWSSPLSVIVCDCCKDLLLSSFIGHNCGGGYREPQRSGGGRQAQLDHEQAGEVTAAEPRSQQPCCPRQALPTCQHGWRDNQAAADSIHRGS